jgi:hypothetical protein
VADEIIAFDATTAMLPDAAALLAQRHREQRASRPELPARWEDPEAARSLIETLCGREWAAGVAAISDGRMRGYLIGEMVLDELWGRSAWVRFAGSALASGQDPELVRDLYAALADRWVGRFGCHAHFALVPPDDRAVVERWFALGFGIEQVHGLLALDGMDLAPRPFPPGVEIRRAGPQDRGTPRRAFRRHLASSGAGAGVGHSPAGAAGAPPPRIRRSLRGSRGDRVAGVLRRAGRRGARLLPGGGDRRQPAAPDHPGALRRNWASPARATGPAAAGSGRR